MKLYIIKLLVFWIHFIAIIYVVSNVTVFLLLMSNIKKTPENPDFGYVYNRLMNNKDKGKYATRFMFVFLFPSLITVTAYSKIRYEIHKRKNKD